MHWSPGRLRWTAGGWGRGHCDRRRRADGGDLTAEDLGQGLVDAAKNADGKDDAGEILMLIEGEGLFVFDCCVVGGGIGVQALHISANKGYKIGAERIPLVVDQFAAAQEVEGIIRGRAFFAQRGAEPAFCQQGHQLQGAEIIFGLGPGKAIGHFGIGGGEDMGDAKTVAGDGNVAGVDLGAVGDLGVRLGGGVDESQVEKG